MLNNLIKISIILVCLSIAYYFFIFQPQQKQQQINLQKAAQDAKGQQASELKSNLNNCLSTSLQAYADTVHDTCIRLGYQDIKNCPLSNAVFTNLDNQFIDLTDQCYKRYPQNLPAR